MTTPLMTRLFCMAAATALWATTSTGCLLVGGQTPEGCFEDCYEEQVCSTYCDAWSCWDECWYDTVCDLQCPVVDDTVDVVPTVECIDDIDCVLGTVCTNSVCVEPASNSKNNAKAGLCQACESTSECVEADARCVRLNYEHASKSGEKICSRICEIDDDCPINFECVNVSSEVGVPAQCLPKAQQDGFRTCTNNPSLECVKAKECGVGESCVDNSCVSPQKPGAQCSRSNPCAQGQLCRDQACVDVAAPECKERKDCAANEMCSPSGTCEVQNTSCVFNSECDGGKCVDGQCIAGCTKDAECGSYERCRIISGQTQGLCEAVECRRNADCDPGQVCADALCQTSCSATRPCASGFVCGASGVCEADMKVECRTTAECGKDKICDGNACIDPCMCNQDCATGQVCDSTAGVCKDPAASMPPAQTCQTNCDCPSGQSCGANKTCG